MAIQYLNAKRIRGSSSASYNGAVKNSDLSPTAIGSQTSWYLGSRSSGNEGFSGNMLDCAVWHRALTDSERSVIFNDGNGALATSVSQTELKWYYRGDSADGVNDATGGDSFGTSANATVGNGVTSDTSTATPSGFTTSSIDFDASSTSKFLIPVQLLPTSGDWAVSMWLRPDNISGNQEVLRDAFEIVFRAQASPINISWNNTPATVINLTENTSYTAGNWNNFILVKTGGIEHGYWNSVDDKASLIGTGAGSAKFTGVQSGADTAITVGSGSTALTPTNFTIAFWYKPTSISSPNVQRLYNNAGSGAERIEVQCYNSRFYIGFGVDNNLQTANLVNDKTEHWVITNDSGTITAYRDNVQDATGTAGHATRNDTASNKHISADGESLNGNLGEFVITTDVITSAERASLASGGSPSALDNKVLYYPLTANFNDYSGNDYHGTATGSTITTIDTNIGFPTGSDLPENTIFEETNTKKYYFLQSGAWKAET